MILSDSEFRTIRDLVYKHTGIYLTESKKTLIVARFHRTLMTKGFKDFSEYCAFVEKDSSGRALSELVNRISTNHTFFYREKAHFEFLSARGLPEIREMLIKQRSRDLRVWCAGCATGEEAYTIVMMMLEYFGSEYVNWDAGVLATDISGKVLEIAKEGIYSEERLEHLPEYLKKKYFRKTLKGLWEISNIVRKEVTFRRFNLMNTIFPFREKFHIIFCRNVMIYFDRLAKDALVKRFYEMTSPGGYLFVGHSESLERNRTAYRYVVPAVYKKGMEL